MSNLVDLKLVADTTQAEAILEKFAPTNDGMWRSICRSYSQKFATPLHLVLEMDPEYVLQHHYESELELIDTEENFEALQRMLRMIADPNYVQAEEEELNDFIAESERQEAARLKAGKAIHPGMGKGKPFSETNLPTPEMPKEGFVDFSKLNQSEES